MDSYLFPQATVGPFDRELYDRVYHKLMYDLDYRPDNEERERESVYWRKLSHDMARLNMEYPRFTSQPDYTEWLARHYIHDSPVPEVGTFRSAVLEFAAGIGLQDISVVTPPGAVSGDDATGEDVTASLIGFPVIDTTNASWEQILELRRDTEAKRKLRRLRLFLYKNYAGKGKAFVEDDIFQRLEDHEMARQDHGLETRRSKLSILLDSKSAQTTIITTVGSILAGQPIVATAAAMVGISVEVGKFVLNIRNREHAFNKLRRDHELAYIFEVRDQLGS